MGRRLLATAGSWFLWDFSFYGNKVFQSTFIQILSPGASLFTTLLWTLLNSGCALIGYYFSAALVDNPKVWLPSNLAYLTPYVRVPIAVDCSNVQKKSATSSCASAIKVYTRGAVHAFKVGIV